MDLPLHVPRMAAGDDFVLRAWQLGDLPLVREAAGDDYIPLITTVPAVYSDEAGTAFIRRQWKRVTDRTGYPFVIVSVKADRPVGTVGLWLQERGQGRASLGYWIVGSARGRGAAAAALGAVSTWALRDLRIPRLQLLVEPWNTASLRTAKRAGFQREGLLRDWQRIGDGRRDMIMHSKLGSDAD